MELPSIDDYEHGGDRLAMAIRGLTPGDMQEFPVPGGWSIHQIVIHLVDSDLVMADRMKRIIAMDNPTLLAFGHSEYVQKLFYHDQPVEPALALFDLNRKSMAGILRRLPREAFDRKGTHNERGPLTLADVLKLAIGHLDHHLKFINDKREMLGKSMW